MTSTSIHEETDVLQFRDPNQPNLHLVYWTREPIQEKQGANLLLWVHGQGEHSACYKDFAQRILPAVPQLDAILTYDLRNHGNSDGEMGAVRALDDLINDLHDHVLPRMAIRYGMNANVVIGGHSLGGLIVTAIATRPDVLQRDECGKIHGIVLSAPALDVNVQGTLNRALSPLVGYVCNIPGTRSRMKHRGFGVESLSHCTETMKAKSQDEKVFDQVSLGLAADMLSYGTKLIDKIKKEEDMVFKTEIPVLVLHGTEDSVIKLEGSQRLVAALSANSKSSCELKEVEGSFHEMHNELEDRGKAVFYEYIVSFLKKSFSKPNH